MGPLLAEEELRSHGSRMSSEQLRQAMLMVTGDEREADRAAAERQIQESRAKHG